MHFYTYMYIDLWICYIYILILFCGVSPLFLYMEICFTKTHEENPAFVFGKPHKNSQEHHRGAAFYREEDSRHQHLE